MRLIIISAIFIVTLSGLISAATFIYDNFQGQILDSNKWIIEHARPPEAASCCYLDISLLNTTEGRFHSEQLQSRDAATVLSITRQFQADEQVELEVYYNSGSGNREIKPVINDMPLDLRMRDIDNYNCGGCPTSGNIGYWGGESEVGNQLGLWKIKVKFLSNNNATITFVRPDNSLFVYETTQITYPAKFGMETLVGHNGLIHSDYDNVVVKTPGGIGSPLYLKAKTSQMSPNSNIFSRFIEFVKTLF